ncbi:MAG: Serine hydroxymethyltransferase [Syntrophorhabdaceae bacterium PtaU1.Bin034]|nr:MAG: Serine hydroxymethyltransferase [Syntrophorhabdaceae bacterium PtaU1.Bin034]
MIAMDALKGKDREIYDCIRKEIEREEYSLILIASENYVDQEILEVQGTLLTNKYAEGYPERRYYGGCRYVDEIEQLTIERACRLFGAEHANVQPHSGSAANMAVLYAVLKPGDKILGMDLAHGGHLTHGARVSFSGRFFQPVSYQVSQKNEEIDYDEVRAIALKEKPKLIIAGASAYSRIIDFERFRQIADEIGAFLLVDIAHIAGAVATGLHPSPVGFAHFVTTTTHKTLRGPRGGLILCDREFAKPINSMIFPGIQGGPLMHVIAAKAVALRNAMTPEFKTYQEQIIRNARHLASAMEKRGYRIVSGGTDNHLFLVDLSEKGITGKEAELSLEKSGIMLNKNLIPFDTKGPNTASGVRIGTPAVTTRGMKEPEMESIAEMIDSVLQSPHNERLHDEIRERVKDLCGQFPFYSRIYNL